MRRNYLARVLLGLALTVWAFAGCQTQSEAEKSAEEMSAPDPKQELVEFVAGAAAAVEERGEDAFADFRQTDDEWFTGDKYVFVIDLEGNALCNPASPDLEGTNVSDVVDSEGVSPTGQMLTLLETSDSGWISYMWPKPGMTEPSKKSSYVMKAKLGDKVVAVGSGMYVE